MCLLYLFLIVEYGCVRSIYNVVNMEGSEMDIRQTAVRAFLVKCLPPKEWAENLKQHFPSAGEIATDIPIVRVVDEDREVIVLKASEVCTDQQVKAINAFPPDGMWITWADLVVPIVGQMLAKHLEETLLAQGLREVPAGYRVQLGWQRAEQKVVVDFK